MKKLIFIGLLISIVSFGAELDAKAGASVNGWGTKKEYNKLMKRSKKAVKANDWFLREKAIEKIETFLEKIEKASKGKESKKKEKYEKNLDIAVVKLLKVDGLAGASINPGDLKAEYNLTIELADKAIKTGENKIKAIREVNELIQFIEKWKNSQSGAAKGHMTNFENKLRKKLKRLMK